MKIINLLITIIISVALIGVVASSINTAYQSQPVTDTFTSNAVYPVNFTLSGYDFDTIVSVTNGTVTIASGNYTIHESDGNNKIEMLTNTSALFGSSFTVNYKAYGQGSLTGVSALLIALMTLIVVAGLIIYIKGHTLGKK